ncbi:MAG: tyrosine-type recombinase/integrase [Devosia sp.]|uniref:site-specific integrase n=1 Tax=Devosia sp. TaxID=1871048 RepID=UPI003395F836
MPHKSSIPGTKRVRSKGRVYYYFDTGQTKPNGKPIYKRLPDPKSPGFGATYGALMAAKKRRASLQADPAALTITQLIELYENSAKFRKLAPSSQTAYRIYLKQFREAMPTAPAHLVERKDIILMVDKRANKPGAANLLVWTIGALYKWAREREHVTNDPCRDIDPQEIGEHDPWPEDLLTKALAAEDAQIRLAVHLLYYTALRIGDVLRIRWQDIRNGAITITPQKTQRSKTGQLVIPVHSALERELSSIRRDIGPVLIWPDGRSRSKQTLRAQLQGFAAALGFEVVPHGLRKNAVNSLLECGCTVAETASISGQTLQMVEHYAKGRQQAKLGQTAMAKWEKTQ